MTSVLRTAVRACLGRAGGGAHGSVSLRLRLEQMYRRWKTGTVDGTNVPNNNPGETLVPSIRNTMTHVFH
ncbi:MAG: hypothetical protein ACN6RL_13855, partial [Variovorax sp.]